MITASELDYETIEDVDDQHPSAYKIVPVHGGWAVFYTREEYETWLNQI